MNENVLYHPLITHKLAILRDINTGTKEFRELVTEISTILRYEAMKDAKLEKTTIETPLEKMETGMLNEDKYAVVPILRAGMGMVEGILNVIPNAKIGHIGLYRNKDNFKPVEYYYKMPEGIGKREAIVIDSMLGKLYNYFVGTVINNNIHENREQVECGTHEEQGRLFDSRHFLKRRSSPSGRKDFVCIRQTGVAAL